MYQRTECFILKLWIISQQLIDTPKQTHSKGIAIEISSIDTQNDSILSIYSFCHDLFALLWENFELEYPFICKWPEKECVLKKWWQQFSENYRLEYTFEILLNFDFCHCFNCVALKIINFTAKKQFKKLLFLHWKRYHFYSLGISSVHRWLYKYNNPIPGLDLSISYFSLDFLKKIFCGIRKKKRIR